MAKRMGWKMNRGLSGWIPVVSILFPVACFTVLRALGSPSFHLPMGVMLPPTFVIAIVWTGLGCKSPYRSVVNGLILWLGFVSITLAGQSISHPVDDYRPVGWDGLVSILGIGVTMLAGTVLVAQFRHRPELVFFRDSDVDRMSLADLFIALGLLGLSLGGFRFAGLFQSPGFFVDITTPEILEMAVMGVVVAAVGGLFAIASVAWTSWISRTSKRTQWRNSVTIQCLLLTGGLTALAVSNAKNAGEFAEAVILIAGTICVTQAIVFFVLLGMREFGRNNVAQWRHVQGDWQKRYHGTTPAAENCSSVATDETRNDGNRFDDFNA